MCTSGCFLHYVGFDSGGGPRAGCAPGDWVAPRSSTPVPHPGNPIPCVESLVLPPLIVQVSCDSGFLISRLSDPDPIDEIGCMLGQRSTYQMLARPERYGLFLRGVLSL